MGAPGRIPLAGMMYAVARARTSAEFLPSTGAKNRGSLPLARSSRRMVISHAFGGLVIDHAEETRDPAGAIGSYRRRRMSVSRMVRFSFAWANFLHSARALASGIAWSGQTTNFSQPARAPASAADCSRVRVPATYPVSMANATIPTRKTHMMAATGMTLPGRVREQVSRRMTFLQGPSDGHGGRLGDRPVMGEGDRADGSLTGR